MKQKNLSDFEPSGVECPTCGKDGFDCTGDMKKHHTLAHGESIAGELVQCDNCGERFRRCQSHLDEQTHNFCSEKCHGEFRSEFYTGEKNPFWSGGNVELVCEQCGDSYTRFPSLAENSRFCSRSCYHKWMGENVNGTNHPNWQGGGGLIPALRRTIGQRSWVAVATEVKENADYECDRCGEKKEPKMIDTHHIVPIIYGGVNHIDNLMPLCKGCHKGVEKYTKTILEDDFKITEFGGESGT